MKNEILVNALNELPIAKQNVSCVSDIINCIDILQELGAKGNFNALVLLDYMKVNIACELTPNASVIEGFFAILLKGNMQTIPALPFNKETKVDEYIHKNRNKKTDIIIGEDYRLSLKSCIPNNNEINMGSFSKEALFYEIYEGGLGERTQGLGSKTQLKDTIEKINSIGNWDKLKERYIYMVKNIYKEDLILMIKGMDYIDLYLLNNETLVDVLCSAFNSPNSVTEVINRFEGNALRINRNALTSCPNAIHRHIDFKDYDFTEVYEIINVIECITAHLYQCPNKNNIDEILKITKKTGH